MAAEKNNTMLLLKILHWLGLLMLVTDIGLYAVTDIALDVSGMLLTATCIGLGAVMMSPFPVVLFIQWARSQDEDRHQDK